MRKKTQFWTWKKQKSCFNSFLIFASINVKLMLQVKKNLSRNTNYPINLNENHDITVLLYSDYLERKVFSWTQITKIKGIFRKAQQAKQVCRLRSWLISLQSRTSVVKSHKINAKLMWHYSRWLIKLRKLWSLMFPHGVRHIISH